MKNIFRGEKKYFFIGVEKKFKYSFDVKSSDLSIYGVSSTLRALLKKLAGWYRRLFSKKGEIRTGLSAFALLSISWRLT